MTKLADMTNRERLQNAFTQAEKKFGIEQLIDPEDVDVDKPDERSIITYVSSLYDVFPKVSHYVIPLRNTCYVTSFVSYPLRKEILRNIILNSMKFYVALSESKKFWINSGFFNVLQNFKKLILKYFRER